MNRTATPRFRQAGTRTRVLVVEDEFDLQELLRYNLDREGYDVSVVGSGERAVEEVGKNPPALILLDLMLPRMDGLQVCRRLKAEPATASIPLIMVTAKGEETDIVAGLELGAHDYIVKPFSPRVLISRIRAVMRRRQQDAEREQQTNAADEQTPLECGPLTILPDRHEVRVNEEPVELSATEFRLLALLARRPGRVFTRQQIIESIHGPQSAVTDRSVDVQVVSLRRKLGEGGDLIQTIRGVGYRFRE